MEDEEEDDDFPDSESSFVFSDSDVESDLESDAPSPFAGLSLNERLAQMMAAGEDKLAKLFAHDSD
jgi:hypothetical protein